MPGEIEIQVIRLAHAHDLPLPRLMTPGAAGSDLHAAIVEPITLLPMQRQLIPTGFVISIPFGYEAQIRPRSGLAIKHGITLINSPGTIDSDYRGELLCAMVNLSEEPFTIEHGTRIAQIIIASVVTPVWKEVEQLSPTSRGEGGFGHTGQR